MIRDFNVEAVSLFLYGGKEGSFLSTQTFALWFSSIRMTRVESSWIFWSETRSTQQLVIVFQLSLGRLPDPVSIGSGKKPRVPLNFNGDRL